MKKTLSQIYYYFSLILIVFLPFQSLLLSVFQDKLLLSPSISFWLAHWYEPVIVVILVLSIAQYLLGSKKSRMNWLALLLVLFGLLSAIFFSPTLSRGIEGFRFDLLPVLIFLLISLQNISKEKTKILFKTYVVMAILAGAWAIAERFLPPNYWANLGLSFHGYGYFGFGKFSFGVLNQSASFIGGPNQLGSYLLPAVFILLYRSSVARTNGEKTSLSDRRILPWFALTVLFVGVLLSFSRSAWVGVCAGLLAFLLFYIKNIRIKYSLLGVMAILLIGLFVAYKNVPAVKDLLVHTSAESGGKSSQEQHGSALDSSIAELKSRGTAQIFFGRGIGTAGPAAIKYSDGVVSESWYIQLLLELGIVGLALWLVFIAGLLIRTYKTSPALFLSLLAVSATALFLHTWADNPAIAISLFVLVGACYNSSWTENRPKGDL